MNKKIKNIDVAMQTIQEFGVDRLSRSWLALEAESGQSFFLSWRWISAWLNQLDASYYVVSVTASDELIGLSIWCQQFRKVFKFFSIEQWWLNRSGTDCFDQCWIEENAILAKRDHENTVLNAVIDFFKAKPKWCEIIVGMADTQTLSRFGDVAPNQRVWIDDEGYKVDLTAITKNYLQDVLSKNTRQKIKQSERILSAQGELSFHVFQEFSSKQQHFQNIARLHRLRWQNSVPPSGFVNPHFSKMMAQLITDNRVHYCCLMLNKQPIGYLINFVHNSKVSFYLSALERFENGKVKLGMLLHLKAIEYYQQSMLEYDFLAGQARYKASMSNRSYSQKMVVYYRDALVLKLENFARKAKAQVKQLFTH